MHKNKKLIMFFKILLVVTCITGIVVGAIAVFKSEKSPETPKTTEAPQLREELTTFDYYLTPEELLEYPVHDMQDYITYDYAAIVNKQQKPLFVSDYYTELLNTPEKHNSCEIPQKTIDEFVKQYEIHKDDEGIPDLNDVMFEVLFVENPIEHNLQGFNDDEFTPFQLQAVTNTMYSNEVHLAFHKNAFDNYKDYYKVSYDLFMDIIKKFEPETIKSSLIPSIVNTTIETVFEKVDEKDYDYLFNAVMNGCFEFRYIDDKTDISFGIQYTEMEDGTKEPFFYVNVINYFADVPEYAQ